MKSLVPRYCLESSRPTRRNLFFSAILTLCLGLAAFSVTNWTTSGMLVWSDGVAYFLYSRSLVIDFDTDLTNDYESIAPRYSSRALESLEANLRYTPDGDRVVVPWPPGNGLVMAPFYAAGYAVEILASSVSNRPPDSYGIIPQFFFGIGALAYGLLGFWATFYICKDFANAGAACLASLSTFFAGTAVFYVFLNPSMAHASSFGLVSLLSLLWFRQWRDGISLKAFSAFSFLIGILITIRYQNVIFGLLALPLLVRHISRTQDIRLIHLVLSGLVGLIPLSLLVMHTANTASSDAQIVWAANGVLTIGKVPIDLKSPYFFDVLFSCRHGAFHWSPVFAIGTLGLIVAGAMRDARALVLLAILAAQVYLIGGLGMLGSAAADGTSSPNWDNHWAGGTSFGMRYLTECTPFFAFGLAKLSASTHRLRWLLITGLFTLVCWNLLLVLAYGLNTVSRSYCVTYADMWKGIGDALKTLFSALS